LILKRPAPGEIKKAASLKNGKSSKNQANLRGVGGVVLGVTVVLAGGVGKTGLALGLAGDSVVGNTRKTVLALTADTLTEGGISAAGSAVTSGRLAESVVTVRDALGETARADIDSAGVLGVEVGLGGRSLRLGEVAAALLNEVGLVLVGLVDDGLRIC